MIRAPLVSPLLLFMARKMEAELPLFENDPWHGLAHLRTPGSDPDWTFSNWVDHWDRRTRESLKASIAASEKHSVVQKNAIQPGEIVRSIAKGASCPDEVFMVEWECAQPGQYSLSLVQKVIEAKRTHRQIWLRVRPEDVAAAAHPFLVRDGLRMGCSWFLSPPQAENQDAYETALDHWTSAILSRSDFDQWVWPWGELILRGWDSLVRHGGLPKRQGAPENWPNDALKWAPLTRSVVEKQWNYWGGQDIVCDMLLGLLSSSMKLREGS